MIEEFVFGNWEALLFFAMVVVFLVIAQRQIVAQLAVRFVRELEDNMEYYVKAGLKSEEKKEWVYEWYAYLPPAMKVVVSEGLWKKLVDKGFLKLYGMIGD